MTKLVVDFCSYQAAKFAVEHWHYSETMPVPPIVKIGAWENANFIGCILFSRGATTNIGKPYRLEQTEICELTRVALAEHLSPVSQVVASAIKLMRTRNKGLRLIVSYADINQSHIGAIYQAMNWVYTGESKGGRKYKTVDGRMLHGRQVSKTGYKPQFGEMRKVPKIDDCEIISQLGKHRYLYPLDRAMRRQVKHLEQPYPKKEHMRAIDGNNLVSNQTRRFDSDPSALDTPERSE